jgi:hypothetical protein
MKILSQTNDITGYHGTVGWPTNMYDYAGHKLYVGDVVSVVTYHHGRVDYNAGIDFVCHEVPEIANWTGKQHQYVMGIADVYNDTIFRRLDNIDPESEEWGEIMEEIDPEWRVMKVKDYSDLVPGEKIGFLKVVEIESWGQGLVANCVSTATIEEVMESYATMELEKPLNLGESLEPEGVFKYILESERNE